jgi:acetyl-CoA C-acetyltransferase
MAIDPRTPVIIGTGQVLQRSDSPTDAMDPVAMMVEAIRVASSDAGLSSVPSPDAIRVVGLLAWNYGNPAHFIAQDLGLSPRELGLSGMGGNTPQTLVNKASVEISEGKSDLVILTGGETTRTRAKAKKANIELNWRKTDIAPTMVSEEMDMVHPIEFERKIYMPIQVYPMFETALRAHAKRSISDHQVHISELWARFSEVAARNPYAWSRQARTAEEIRTVSPNNRMVGFPYLKLMNSNNDVDMSAAIIICSAEKAQALGVPRDRWVFPHSGTDTHEHNFVSNRHHFYKTPAIEIGGARALQLAGVSMSDISIIDLYSCFPSAVQLGAQSLGLDIRSQLTRTGGLPFAGGPWNNYVMHAIATVVNDLRQKPSEKAFVWANGGYTTKHAFGVYSTEPPKDGFKFAYPQNEVDALPRRDVASTAEAAGPATVEAYSVMHHRDGHPEIAHVSCLLADGRRAWGETTETSVMTSMCENEWVGTAVTLNAQGVLHA